MWGLHLTSCTEETSKVETTHCLQIYIYIYIYIYIITSHYLKKESHRPEERATNKVGSRNKFVDGRVHELVGKPLIHIYIYWLSVGHACWESARPAGSGDIYIYIYVCVCVCVCVCIYIYIYIYILSVFRELYSILLYKLVS